MAIKAVGFDYLGVTANLTGRYVLKEMAAHLKIDEAKLRQAYLKYSSDFQSGKVSKAKLWQQVAIDLDVPEEAEAIIRLSNGDLPIVNPGILVLVKQLRTAGYKVGLLSNMATGTAWHLDLQQSGIGEHFDAVLLSGDAHMTKPDPDLFRLFCADLDVMPEELIFIDDRQSSIEGIESIGITPILFKNEARLSQQLTEFGLKF